MRATTDRGDRNAYLDVRRAMMFDQSGWKSRRPPPGRKSYSAGHRYIISAHSAPSSASFITHHLFVEVDSVVARYETFRLY